MQDVVFLVRLLSAMPEPVVLDYETVAETAVANDDFMAQSGQLTFAPGVLNQLVVIPVVGDSAVEADETFCLKVTYNDPVSPLSIIATAVILNDDEADDANAEAYAVFLPLTVNR